MQEGILYIIATPIGNLEDITLRAIRILNEADLIVCEDTRKSLILFQKYNIKPKKLFAYFKGQEKIRLNKIIEFLKEGKKVALISESGTPCIQDPGFLLVKKCHEEKIPVVAVPGPSALIAALSVSGMKGDSFIFFGFPSKKRKKRYEILESLRNEEKTAIFYLSPHKLTEFLEELESVLDPERKVFLIREITKKFEEYKYGNISQLKEWAQNKKGEFTLVIEGRKFYDV